MSILPFTRVWFVGSDGGPFVGIDAPIFVVELRRRGMEIVRILHTIQILGYCPLFPSVSDEITLFQPRESGSNRVRIFFDSGRNFRAGERLVPIRIQVDEYLLGDARTIR